MNNVFEFKLQTPSLKSVDINTTEMAKDFADFRAKAKKELADFKAKVESSTVYKDAQNALKKFPLYADPASLTLRVGETSIKANTQEEYEQNEKMLNQTLGDANAELAKSEQLKKLEEEAALKKAKKEADNVESDVKRTELKKSGKEKKNTSADEQDDGETDETSGEASEEREKQAKRYPTFSEMSLLEYQYAQHPEYAKQTTTTREERKLQRQTERFENAGSERARARRSRKIERTANKIAQKRAETVNHMSNAAADYLHGEEMEHQSWYYNDIINALTKDPKSNRVHYFDDHILIDTYHPLFTNADNFKGTIQLTGNSIDAYMQHTPEGRRYTAEEQRYYNQFPEDKEHIENKGGVSGALADALVKYTNFPPNSAPALKSAAKIGLIIGGGILAWKTIKHIFNIGGKNEKGDAWKRGLGAAAVLIGVPALTGQRIDQLLFSGDAKKAWKDTSKLLHLDGLTGSIEDLFADVNRIAIDPALGNIKYHDMTVEEFKKYTYIDETTGKRKVKVKELKEYWTKKALESNDKETIEDLKNRIALLEAEQKNHQENTIVDRYGRDINVDGADKNALCGELYQNYIQAQMAAGKLLEDNKNLKIDDQKALDDYLVEQIVKNGKKPSDIKLKDLISHGVVVVAAPAPDSPTAPDKNTKAPDAKDPDAPDSPTAPDKNTKTPKAPDQPEKDLVDREKVEKWSKESWEKFCNGVKSAGVTIADFAASVYTGEIFHRNDSEKLQHTRGTLKFAKELLKDLTKRKELQEETNVTEAEIHKVEVEIQDLEVQAIKMSEMMLGDVDPVLNTRKETPKAQDPAKPTPEEEKEINAVEEQKKELTRDIRKLNFELKFKSPNDEVTFFLEKDQLFIQSSGEKTLIRYEKDGNYYMDKYMVPFKDPSAVIRLANLTNFAKVNFANRATTHVEKAWFIANDGDLTFDKQTKWDAFRKGDVRGMVSNITVLDGEDGYKSAIKELGGDVLESQKAQYADYLNTLQDANGKSLWVMKADKGLPEEELKTMESLFIKPLDIIKNGDLGNIDRPPEYEGKEVINDKNATVTKEVGYLTLHSHGKDINIVPAKTDPKKYQIGYINANDKDVKLNGDYLEINFTTPEEAIKVANLVNFYQAVYSGYGTGWSKAFNISSFEGGLEFAKNGFGPTHWFDLNALGNRTAITIYSKEFNPEGMEIFKNRLNSLKDR